MAAAGQPQHAPLPPLPNIPGDMCALFWSLCSAVHLSPIMIGHIIDCECRGKRDSENYRAYAEAIRDKTITDEEWITWCSFSGSRIQTSTNTEKLDMTALNCLFNVLWSVRKETEVLREKGRLPLTYVHDRPMDASVQTDDVPGLLSISVAAKKDRPFNTSGERIARPRSITTAGQIPIKTSSKNYTTVKNASVQAQDISWVVHEVKNVKNLRNEIVHSSTTARDPASFSHVVSAIEKVIEESRDAYILSDFEVQELRKKLRDEIDQMSSVNKTALPYICAVLLTRGKETTRNLWEQRFTHEQLLFDADKVRRQAVFHALEVMLRNERDRNVLPYTKLLEATEQCIVVSGLAGSGKTTLLKNITLQFFELHQAVVDYLKSFSLLVYIDCKDRDAKTMNEVIEQQFEDLCMEFQTELVAKALFRLDVLFLVDAFDEANPNSTLVLQELMKKAWRTNCRILITSRPQAAKQLGQMLAKHDVCFAEYEILPLTDLEDQLNFLQKLGKCLDDDKKTQDMLQCFLELNQNVRSMFTEPINLVLFCHLFRYVPDRIPHLKNPGQVAQEVFFLYKTLIEQKLSDCGYSDLSLIIDDQFLIVGEVALQLLREGALSFTNDEFLSLQRLCKQELKAGKTLRDVDTQVFLSVFLKLHRPLAGTKSLFWTFNHKTLQEQFAARYLVKMIRDTEMPIKELLAVSTASNSEYLDDMQDAPSSSEWLDNQLKLSKPFPPLRPFLEVLQYVVQDLNKNHSRVLERRWPEFKTALEDAGVLACEEWQRCMMSCPGVVQIAHQAAKATRAERETWMIVHGSDAAVVACMLPHAQPSMLRVEIEPIFLRQQPWVEIVALREGKMGLHLESKFSFDGFSPCDDIISHLHNSKIRLVDFEGCISCDASVETLASVSTAETTISVWLEKTLDLTAFEGKCSRLAVHTRPLNVNGHQKAVPLPADTLPRLIIENFTLGSWKIMADTVKIFAPASRRFGAVKLTFKKRNYPSVKMVDFEPGCFSGIRLDPLVKDLHVWGVRTASEGRTRWENHWITINLHITDEPPQSRQLHGTGGALVRPGL